VTATQIPDKFHFKIGEVSRILGVKPYVVRFWESEFRITPAKNQSQHRVYKRQELETLLEGTGEGSPETVEARPRRKPVQGDAAAGEKGSRKNQGDACVDKLQVAIIHKRYCWKLLLCRRGV
jgi:hypothetical protein